MAQLAFISLGIILFVFAIVIGIYVAMGIFLTKFNKLVYGKGTVLAWLPITNTYLLGKLTVNKIVGWTLVAVSLLTGKFSTTINGVEKSFTILPETVSSLLRTTYSFAVLGLFIYAIIKYNKIKKGEIKPNIENNNITNEQPIVTSQVNNVTEPINNSTTTVVEPLQAAPVMENTPQPVSGLETVSEPVAVSQPIETVSTNEAVTVPPVQASAPEIVESEPEVVEMPKQNTVVNQNPQVNAFSMKPDSNTQSEDSQNFVSEGNNTTNPVNVEPVINNASVANEPNIEQLNIAKNNETVTTEEPIIPDNNNNV